MCCRCFLNSVSDGHVPNGSSSQNPDFDDSGEELSNQQPDDEDEISPALPKKVL